MITICFDYLRESICRISFIELNHKGFISFQYITRTGKTLKYRPG